MPAVPFPRPLALLVAASLALGGMSAGAVELPPGSKNFSPPSATPNYFSNEVGAAQGRSAGSVPIGHISGPSVGHAVVMSGPRGKPGKVVRAKGHGRGAAVRGRAMRVASRRGSAASHSYRKATKAAAASAAHKGGRRR